MSWTHDTGDPFAYRYVGYPTSVLHDGAGTATTAPWVEPDVTAWRAACGCGRRGTELYSCLEWPGLPGAPPPAVQGWDTESGADAVRRAHLDRVLRHPGVHDLARRLDELRARRDAAIRAPRRAGLSWAEVGGAAGPSEGCARHRRADQIRELLGRAVTNRLPSDNGLQAEPEHGRWGAP